MTDADARDPRWERLETLYEAALALPEHERRDFVDSQCQGDDPLRREVESLLAFSPAAEAFFTRIGDDVRDAVADRLPDVPDERIGTAIRQYRIEARLGAGGMGVVYRAYDTQLQRMVALKLLPAHLSDDDVARDRFLNEARAVAALDHPNICAIHETGETESGAPFLAMAFCDGETLKSRIARGPLPLGEALDIATQMARGLAVAHGRGIVHRDIKPGNVILTTGLVKLVDFGLARLPDVTLTAPGLTPGTVAYMAPEQLRGDRIDARADLWSLGIVLYEMLAGVRPFDGDSNATIGWAVTHDEPLPLAERRPDLAPAVVDIVDRLLEKDRQQRYASADQLLEDVLDVLTGARPLQPPKRRSPARRSGRANGRSAGPAALRRWLLAATAVATTAIAGFAIVQRIQTERTLAPPWATTFGILPVNTIGMAPGTFDLLVSAYRIRLRSNLTEAGVTVVSAQTIEAYMNQGVALDSIARATGTDFFIETILSYHASDTIEAAVSLSKEGIRDQPAGTVRLSASSPELAETLARQAAQRLLAGLLQDIREHMLQRTTMNDEAERLRRRASQVEAMARLNLDVAGLITPPQRDSVLALAAQQFDSANALLILSARKDRNWTVPRLEQARLSEWRAVVAHARGGDTVAVRRAYDDGIAAMNEVLRKTPDDPLALALRGQLRWQRSGADAGRSLQARLAIDSAARDLQRAIDEEPELARPAADYADLLFKVYGDYDQAASYAQQAYDIDKFWARASEVIGILASSRFEQGRDSVAAAVCSDGIRDHPDDPSHYGCFLDVMAWGSLRTDADTAWAYYELGVERLYPGNTAAVARFGYAMAAILAQTPSIPPDSARSVMVRMDRLVDESMPPGSSERTSLLPWRAGLLFRLSDRSGANALFNEFHRRDSMRARLFSNRRVLRGFVNVDSLTNPR